MQEAKYSANFRKYKGETDYQFTVRSDQNPDEHLDSVIAYTEACDVRGFRDKPGVNGKAGLAEGEESWPVNGYVVGRCKQKDGSTGYVLWMYGRGRYKTASVYSEKWDRLWFVPNTAKQWPTSQAPESEEARSSGYLVEVPEQEIVLVSFVNREGEKRRAFDRVLGAGNPKQPVSPPVAAPSPAAVIAETIINSVQTGATSPDVLVRFGERAMLRRPEIGTEWSRVESVFRAKLTPMRYQFSKESVLGAIEKLRPVLGETNYRDLLTSMADAPADEIPF